MRPVTIAATIMLSALLFAGCASDEADGADDGDAGYESRGYGFVVIGRAGGRNMMGPYESRNACHSAKAREQRSGRWSRTGPCSRL